MLVKPLMENSRRLLEKERTCSSGLACSTATFRRPGFANWQLGVGSTSSECTCSSPIFRQPTPTLLALGYSSKEATWKARRQARYVINKTERALEAVGLSRESASDIILTWEKDGYESDAGFRKDCQDAASWVLEKRLGNATARTDVDLDLAAKYLLSEMPLFVDSPGILEKESSVFVYHQCPALLDFS